MKQAKVFFSLFFNVCLFALIGAEWNSLMENPNLFEGDIELNAEQKMKIFGYATTSSKLYRHWLHGEPIPYELDPKFASSWQKAKLKGALADYERKTCLRFVERTDPTKQKEYLKFVPGRGCSSPIGMQFAGNYIRLADGCFSRGTLLHEIAHSLGIWHEQNRPDRDKYIKVNYQNLKCCRSQFLKLSNRSIDSLGFPYDYESMMHYGAYAFGNGKGPVIEVLDKTKRIGQRSGFSKIDIAQINKMYRCGEPVTKPPKITTTTTTANGYCIKHATSGKYLSYNSQDNMLYFSSTCMKFQSLENLSIAPSKCASLQNNYITLGSTCSTKFRRTSSSRLFSIQHVTTSKCVHPSGGSPNPKDGTKAVIFSGCNEARLKFLLEGASSISTPLPTPAPPKGFLFRHAGGMCLAINAEGLLSFSNLCNQRFDLSARTDRRLKSVTGNSCAYVTGTSSDSTIKFSSKCKESFRKVEVAGSYFAVQHVATMKCIHPKGGSHTPKHGTVAIIYHSCGGNRLKFKME